MSNEIEIVSGAAIKAILPKLNVINIISQTYMAHHAKTTVNPDSYFLRFPDRPRDRIIALPAAINSEPAIAGIKWIASYPGNVEHNLPRASAVLILNDYTTGYPLAVLEGSEISASRTAASAVLAARVLTKHKSSTIQDETSTERRSARNIGVIGAGVISRAIFEMFKQDGWEFESITIYDTDTQSANQLSSFLNKKFGSKIIISNSADETIKDNDIVVLTTTAAKPYINKVELFTKDKVILNISLRDLSSDIILSSYNVFDDIEHCMKANTSAHLAEQASGNRDFAHATLAEIMNDEKKPHTDKPIIFSPFGLGVLDIALGQAVLSASQENGTSVTVKDFIPSLSRW